VYECKCNGTRHLVKQARKYNAKFVYISTDYVFDGEKEAPYETSDNTKSSIGIWPESKYLGEKETILHDKHFIIRISWVFGKNGNNFVKTMLRLGKRERRIKRRK
jgi:dTDP-4-dehydrorhamnose reductase